MKVLQHVTTSVSADLVEKNGTDSDSDCSLAEDANERTKNVSWERVTVVVEE